MIRRVKHHAIHIRGLIKIHGWRKTLAVVAGVLLGFVLLVQIFYPTDRLLPGVTIDGLNVGVLTKTDALYKLDTLYNSRDIALGFQGVEEPYTHAKASDLGIRADNAIRLQGSAYPWYLRIVPSSIFWAGYFQTYTEPSVVVDTAVMRAYVASFTDETCHILTEDARIEIRDQSLEVVPAKTGGVCVLDSVYSAIQNLSPASIRSGRISFAGTPTYPDITTAEASDVVLQLEARIGTELILKVSDNETVVVPKDVLYGWLFFEPVNGTYRVGMAGEPLDTYMTNTIAPKVQREIGTTTIDTLNFKETKRDTGVPGRRLAVDKTVVSILAYLRGEANAAYIVTNELPATTVYKRSFSDTNNSLNALIDRYAQEHSGTYGVSMIELSGEYRRGVYNDTKVFITASTYKLFVAYSTLLRVESGRYNWSDYVTAGQNLSQCFDNMIVNSDNACAETLITRIGRQNITDDAHAIGCSSTSFIGSSITTTAGDLMLLLGQLQTGQILSMQTSRDKLINDMKNNVYRNGIPRGLSGLDIADKVGFLDGLLHDAAIVYSPSSTYILVILTDNASWANIAELAGEIEAWRAQ